MSNCKENVYPKIQYTIGNSSHIPDSVAISKKRTVQSVGNCDFSHHIYLCGCLEEAVFPPIPGLDIQMSSPDRNVFSSTIQFSVPKE